MSVIDGLNTVLEFIKGDISSEQAATELIEFVPPFELRIYILLGILSLFLIVNGAVILLRFQSSKKSKGKKFSLLNPIRNLISKFKKKLKRRNKGRNKGKTEKVKDTKVAESHKSHNSAKKSRFTILLKACNFFKKLFRRSLLIFNVSFLVVFIAVIGVTIFTRPILLSSNPVEGARMKNGEETITVEFDIPVDKNSIEFNLSPDVEGKWKFEQIVPWLPYSRRATFHPRQSFFPDKEVIVYIVGLRSSFFSGKKHELALEFKSPLIPDIASTSPKDKDINIAVDEEVITEFDSDLGDFVDIAYKVEPAVEFETDFNGDKSVLKFKKPLQQDQNYKVEIFRTPRSYDIRSGEDIEKGDTESIKTFSFNTVTTPLVKSYEPKGDSARADKKIKIEFDQSMDQQSVEDKFSINPEVKGEIKWDDDKTLVFEPEKDLKKETAYEVKVAKGALSKVSGMIEDDIVLNFTTIGRVKVISHSPVNGASGLNPGSTNVVVEFNQQVDHGSAQSRFSISPAVSGNFGWEGNKLVFYSAGKLAYNTRYTVTVNSGVKTVHGLDSNQPFSFVFVTKPNIVALNVPWYKQQEGFTCNLAAARMALAYRGVYVSENQIRSAIGTGGDPNVNWVSGYGVHWGPIANYIGNYRRVSVKSGWNTAALAKEVENGNPVIVWWYNRYSQPPGAYTLDSGATGYMGMHSEVVRGFIGSSSNPTSLMTNDPWRGRLTYSRGLFDSTWAYMGYIAVVVY
jgi:uncharacterized protein YvpB